MPYHDIEIEITKEGKVKATIRGAKGKGCLKYAQLLEEIVGQQESLEFTPEYYEPDSSVSLSPTLEQHFDR